MNKYTMNASNGSVVAIESSSGGWIKSGDVDYEMSTLRYEKEEVIDELTVLKAELAEARKEIHRSRHPYETFLSDSLEKDNCRNCIHSRPPTISNNPDRISCQYADGWPHWTNKCNKWEANAALSGKEKDAQIAYLQNDNTDRMTTVKRQAEEIAALKEEIEQWKRIVVTHVEEIQRLREALDTIESMATDQTFDIQKIAQDALTKTEVKEK